MAIAYLRNLPSGADAHLELKKLLDLAKPGDIVYVDDALEIRCDDGAGAPKILEVKEGVTLMSGRGSFAKSADGKFRYSKGALLYSKNDAGTYIPPFLKILGSNAKLSGLRIKGIGPAIPELRVDCVFVDKSDYCVVESCEFSSPGHGISFNRSVNVIVRNCWFHDHRRIRANPEKYAPYSYPIVVSAEPVFMLVENNYFANNWHAVASRGNTNTGYEARGNLVDVGHGSAFDVHAYNPNTTPGIDVAAEDSFDNADYGTAELPLVSAAETQTCADTLGSNCQYLYVHANLFLNAGNAGVLMRGCPAELCIVQRNFFVQNEARAIKTGTSDTLDIGSKLVTSGNYYNWVPPVMTPHDGHHFNNTIARMLSPSLPPRA